MKKFLLTISTLGLFFSISTTTATAATVATAATTATATPIQANTNRSILDNIVVVTSRDNDVYGTGFFISPYGHILTNEHVIHDGKSFKLCYRLLNEAGVACYDSDKLKVLAKDSNLDLALLQLPQIPNAYNNNYLILGDSNSAKIGDEINVLGYPQDDLLSLDLSKGLISKFVAGYILTDAQMLPGNSGSPVLNSKNEVIGIAVAILGAEYDNAGVLIPSNIARDWLISIGFNPKSGINKLAKPKKPPVFISKDGGFSINFPGKPTFFSEDEFMKSAEITTYNYIYKKNENEILMVGYFNITPEQLKEFNSSKFSQKAISDLSGDITFEEIKVNKNGQAIFYKAKTSEGLFITAQIYVTKDKFYLIAGLKKDAYPDDKEINSFIKSFKLLPN